MKNLLKFSFFIAILLGSNIFLSCNKDDEPSGSGNSGKVDPSKVFINGIPSQVGDLKIYVNEDGLVDKILDYGHPITIDYNPQNADGYDIVAKYSGGSWSEVYYMKLNKMGFVSYVYEDYGNNKYDEWWFEYNSDGQLNKMKRSEERETTNITYTNGNITEVKCTDGTHYKFYYPNHIQNKGAIMFFDYGFAIDIDEMEFLYYAGLLGKGTKDLPEISVDQEDGYSMDEEWEFNSEGFPIKYNNHFSIVW